MISWSKCRPLNSSCTEVGSVIRWPLAPPGQLFKFAPVSRRASCVGQKAAITLDWSEQIELCPEPEKNKARGRPMPRSAEVLSESLLEGQLLPFWEGFPLGITSEPFSRHQGFSRLRSKLNAPRQRRDPRTVAFGFSPRRLPTTPRETLLAGNGGVHGRKIGRGGNPGYVGVT